MNKSTQLNLWIYRIGSLMWFSYWWIFVGIILGQQIGWAIGGQSNQPDALGKIGAACGFAVGVFAGWLTWRRSPEYQLSIGDRFLYRQDVDGAITAYTKGLDARPHPMLFMRRGLAYLAKGEYVKAKADFSEALRLKPNFTSAYSYRAGAHLAVEDFAAAITDFTAAINLNYRTPEIYGSRAYAYYRVGNMSAALDDLWVVLRLKPNSATAYYLRGKIYQDQGKTQEAVRDYQKSLELEPQHSNASEMHEYLAAQQG